LSTDVYIFEYIVQEDVSFSKILKKFIKKGAIVRSDDPGTKQTLLKYPQKNWKDLKTGEKFDLHITKDKANLTTINNYLNSLSPKGKLTDYEAQASALKEKKTKKKPLKQIQNKKRRPVLAQRITKKKNKRKKKLKKNLYYIGGVLSKSLYEEDIKDKIELDYDQTSFTGLIFGYKRYLKNRRYSVKTDFKINFYQESEITGDAAGERSISPEITNQTHLMYRMKRSNLFLLGGLKYMNFSTFDLEKNYLSSSTFELINHNIISAQFGTSYLFRSFRKLSTLEFLISSKLLHISDYKSDFILDTDLTYSITPMRKTKIFLSYSYLMINGDSSILRHRITTGLSYFFF
jgi:hypothetical protein